MKHYKTIGIFALFFVFSILIKSQTIIPPSDELILPQYAITGNVTASRLQYVCRLKLTGLTANATYRYTPAMSTSATLTTSNGPGNFFAVNNTSGANGYVVGYTSGKSLNSSIIGNDEFTSSNRYGEFTTDASGNYTGWFSVVPTSNAVFAQGNACYFYVQVNNGAGGTSIAQSFRTTSVIAILDYGTTSGGINQATGVIGRSFSNAEEFILLYDNTSGTGRPIYAAWTENDGITSNFTTWYNPASNGVDGYQGRWGAVIPNNNVNGIKRIEKFNINASSLGFSTSPDGLWGSANTVNPSGGSVSILLIDSISSPLPVEISFFSHSVIKNTVKLSWQTVWELNNYGFKIERKTENTWWKEIGFIKGSGTTNNPVNYVFTDNAVNSNSYYYRIKQVDFNGNYEYFNLQANVQIGNADEFSLNQNFPNPFNPVTQISYSLSNQAFVNLEIFDIRGSLVKQLVNGNEPAGYKSIEFNASGLASGIYFYRLSATGSKGENYINKIMKMTIIK